MSQPEKPLLLSWKQHSFFQFSSVAQSLSHVQLFMTPWTAAHQAPLSITNSRSLLKLMSFESVMPPNHLILCRLLLLLPSIFPSVRVFSNESFELFSRGVFFSLLVPVHFLKCPEVYPNEHRYSSLFSIRDWKDGL